MGWLVKELRYPFPDGPIDPATIPEIEALAEWAYSMWKSGERVLIRCQAGMNRSSLLTALVLMRDGKSADEAIALIKERRSPYVLSNSHFVKYLEERGSGDS
jgi:protein-tyrosine phosphatase